MAADYSGVVSGLVAVVIYSLLPIALLWLAFRWRRIAAFAVASGRRFGLVPKPPERPVGPPLEEIAANIRRLSATLEAMPDGTPWARRQGTLMAYDSTLAKACTALEIEQRLTELPFTRVRDIERMRVESELREAGIVMRRSQAV
jgi:hypothetical protein